MAFVKPLFGGNDASNDSRNVVTENGKIMNVSCPVCGGHQLEEFLRRDSVPVHQNLLFSSQADARHLTTGQLSMVVCKLCNFVFNQAFDLSLLSYGAQYDNSQQFSPAFEAHLNQLVDRLINENGIRDCTIVEVGCGKGDFLRRMTASEEFGNNAHGFDPAYVGPDVDANGRVAFHRQFYSSDCSKIPADVVVSRHVIEHIPQPLDLLANVWAALDAAPNARVFFETPCVEWILRNQVAWDFFYEHCSLFTAASLTKAFEDCGFYVHRVDHVFGGQYLWLEAALSEREGRAMPEFIGGEQFLSLAHAYGQRESGQNASWLDNIRKQRRNGPVAIWGAGAKGVTLANLIDPDNDLFSCVVDINPNKQGQYLAGTGHPIVAPTELKAYGVQTVVVLNPNYLLEIQKELVEAGSAIAVVDLTGEGKIAA